MFYICHLLNYLFRGLYRNYIQNITNALFSIKKDACIIMMQSLLPNICLQRQIQSTCQTSEEENTVINTINTYKYIAIETL